MDCISMSQSTLHLGVVMDPISDIAYKKDTTLAMLWAAQERGYTHREIISISTANDWDELYHHRLRQEDLQGC